MFNDSRVIPARLFGRREDTGGTVEVLLLSRLQPRTWQAIGKLARSLVPGRRFPWMATPLWGHGWRSWRPLRTAC